MILSPPRDGPTRQEPPATRPTGIQVQIPLQWAGPVTWSGGAAPLHSIVRAQPAALTGTWLLPTADVVLLVEESSGSSASVGLEVQIYGGGTSSPANPQILQHDWQVLSLQWGLGTRTDVTAKARAKVVPFPDLLMRIKALRILDQLRQAIGHEDPARLPPMQAFIPEDGSILIEWTHRHWRMGFNIEPEPYRADSGWYLVSDQENGDVRASGDLAGIDFHWLTQWALAHIR